MPLHSKRVFFDDFVFVVDENVYEPAEDSFLFAENIKVNARDRVLDIGTGSGILGVVAAKTAREVIAIDLNPYAVRCAKLNARLNHVHDNMTLLQGDLFSALAETAKFDLILFNAPYLPSEQGEEETWLGRAWAGGATGRQVIDQFISQAPDYLRRAGRILFMQSNLAGIDETIKQFDTVGLKADILARLDIPFFETLALVHATL
jgi:release factor glutamine methyltransferase